MIDVTRPSCNERLVAPRGWQTIVGCMIGTVKSTEKQQYLYNSILEKEAGTMVSFPWREALGYEDKNLGRVSSTDRLLNWDHWNGARHILRGYPPRNARQWPPVPIRATSEDPQLEAPCYILPQSLIAELETDFTFDSYESKVKEINHLGNCKERRKT